MPVILLRETIGDQRGEKIMKIFSFIGDIKNRTVDAVRNFKENPIEFENKILNLKDFQKKKRDRLCMIIWLL